MMYRGPESRKAEPEIRHRALFEQAPIGILVYGADLRVVDCNERIAVLLGSSRPEVIGLHIDELRDQRHREALRSAFAGQVVTCDSPYQATASERWLWLSATFAPMRDPSGVVNAVMVLVTDRMAEKTAESARSAEMQLDEAQRLGRVGSWTWDGEHHLIVGSAEFFHILGLAPATVMQRLDLFAQLVHPDDRPACRSELERIAARRSSFATHELRITRPDGTVRVVMLRAEFVYRTNGLPLAAWGTLQDVTERRELEEQLRLAQRMEALGQLAGGVAHDFNNLLTVIKMESDFLEEGLPAEDHLREEIGEIRRAAERGAGLTRRLLAFSRKQVLHPRLVDLNNLVGEITQMLRRLIGEDIKLATNLAVNLPAILADPGQLEQVLVNLAVNARDAMPDGGVLVVSTRAMTATAGDALIPAGNYVVLTVSDTGHGMDESVRQRIFEPFFTTKPAGFGTGLGLSTVLGIVEQSGGHLAVASEKGRGTRFTIHLPVATDRLPAHHQAQPRVPNAQPNTGHATVLLVEDEAPLRAACRRLLEREGFTVIAAADGYDAVSLADSFGDAIDLLVTDMVLPGLSGREIVDRLASKRPNIAVLYMSGYTDDEILRRGLLDEAVNLLEKPFTGTQLLDAVRASLQSAADGE